MNEIRVVPVPDRPGYFKVVEGEKHHGTYRSLKLAVYRQLQIIDSRRAVSPFRKLQKLRGRGRK